MRNFDEARRIWCEHVPPSGQANTVEGELIRAIEKLRAEAIRNGNINWDGGHDRLLQFIRSRILDPQVFSPELIEQNAELLQLISDRQAPCLSEDVYDELSDRAVEYFWHYGSKPHVHDAELHR